MTATASAEPKTVVVKFRCSPSELVRMRSRAAELEMTASELLRQGWKSYQAPWENRP